MKLFPPTQKKIDRVNAADIPSMPDVIVFIYMLHAYNPSNNVLVHSKSHILIKPNVPVLTSLKPVSVTWMLLYPASSSFHVIIL